MGIGEFVQVRDGNGTFTIDFSKAKIAASDSDNKVEGYLQSELDNNAGSGEYTVSKSAGVLSIEAKDGRTFEFTVTGSNLQKSLNIPQSKDPETYFSGSINLSSSTSFTYKFGAEYGLGNGTSVSGGGGGGGGGAGAGAGAGTTIDVTDQANVNLSNVANAQAALSVMDAGLDQANASAPN